MKRLTVDIICNHAFMDKGEMYCLTLYGIDNEEITLELNETQIKLLESRLGRSFYKCCKKEKILNEIDEAGNGKTLECIAKKYYLCDACSFDGINLYGAKRILKVVAEALYRYPKLRSKLCFIGTHHELEKMVAKMQLGDKEVLNAFNLQYICTEETAKKLGGLMHDILTQLINNHESYVATAMSAFGLFDSMLLDKNDYEGYAYLEFTKQLCVNEADGFHPQGCNTPESIVCHELGHLLDDICGLNENEEFKIFYKNLSAENIRYGLSEYACTSSKEFIAEAFAEFMCNPRHREISTRVGELLNKNYNKL